jgi:hypothetical protein
LAEQAVAFKVVSFSTYRTSLGEWRGVDHDARDFVHAVKGRHIDHYSSLKVGGGWHRFDNLNRDAVLSWFGQMVRDYLGKCPVEEPFALVPVPSSRADVAFRGENRTTTIALAVAKACGDGVSVADVLRFDRPRRSACVYRGTRDPVKIFQWLRLVGSIAGQRVVLIDDVMASGGHLRASAAKLLVEGRASSVDVAICAGRADEACVVDPFAIRYDELPDLATAIVGGALERQTVRLPEAEIAAVTHDDVVSNSYTKNVASVADSPGQMEIRRRGRRIA